jgi:hypothetical protein
VQIYGLDFRDLNRLEAFCVHLESTYPRLDVIINNACQTVRRPPAYYAHLLPQEEELDAKVAKFASSFHGHPLIENHASSSIESTVSAVASVCTVAPMLGNQVIFASSVLHPHSVQAALPTPVSVSAAVPGQCSSYEHQSPVLLATVAQQSSSAMTQLRLVDGDGARDPAAFPEGKTDVNGQQVDLRRQNSWTIKLHEVSTAELAEVFAINAMAPTILNARLKGLMVRSPPMDPYLIKWRFIVNVSAMEGKFYRYKTDAHPHTNMAKAALNMMTRTSAQDYVKADIYMTAVDTGWINDEKPIDKAVAHEKRHNFQTPLDEIDAAARVLDPVIAPLRAAQERSRGGSRCPPVEDPPWGHFLKDYMKSEW